MEVTTENISKILVKLKKTTYQEVKKRFFLKTKRILDYRAKLRIVDLYWRWLSAGATGKLPGLADFQCCVKPEFLCFFQIEGLWTDGELCEGLGQK